MKKHFKKILLLAVTAVTGLVAWLLLKKSKSQGFLSEAISLINDGRDAKLDSIKADTAVKIIKVETEHKEKLNELASIAATEEKRLSTDPDAASDALGAALESAGKLDHKT